MSKEKLIETLECFYGFSTEQAVASCKRFLGDSFDNQHTFQAETAILIATYE